MLRGLVVLFLLVNAVLYWWLHDNATALQSDREPQRLNHQVMPDAVQVLPDLPAASAPRRAASAASAGSVSASAADAVVADAAAHGASAAGLARPVSDMLVDAATGSGYDLLVVGGYGHSRLMESIFGGVTEGIVSHAELPILMVH